MANVFLIFLSSLFLLVSFDMLWFKLYALKNIYRPQFQLLNSSKSFTFRKTSAIITWLILAGAMTFLVETLLAVQLQIYEVWLYGSLMGFVIYSVYNGTNYTTLDKYKLSTAMVDTIWGTCLQGVTAVIVTSLFYSD